MTLEEEGAYCRLLWSCWQHGSIPSDPELAARLVGKGCSTTVARVVLPMFEIDCGNGRVTHDRLERERAKQAEWKAKSSAGGKKSAEMRQAFKGGSTTVQPPCQPNGNTPSSSPSPSSIPIPPPVPNPEDTPPPRKRGPRAAKPPLECMEFARFWSEYPKREGKGNAEAAWVKHQCASKIEMILSAVARWRGSEQWTKQMGQFIPQPATWINRRGWEDELIELPLVESLHTQKNPKYGW